MGRIIAVGDIHGCLHTLQKLLETVAYDEEDDIIVFVGDYIDRGFYSYDVVKYIRALEDRVGKEKCICIRGNHEQMAIDAVRHGKKSLWYYNGGELTDMSYKANEKTIKEDVEWFESLPLVYETENLIFCHAGLTYPVLKDNTAQDLLWGREWIKTDIDAREKLVVFGHTPSRNYTSYVVGTGDICIDAACVFGGRLCALVIPENGESVCFYERKSNKDCTNLVRPLKDECV